MSDHDYYWEKAEFQDPEAHEKHVQNYILGIHDSIAFDEQYSKEAAVRMSKLKCARDYIKMFLRLA